MRRKQWEYRSQAVQMINAYAEAMQPKGQTPSDGAAPQRQGLKVGGDTMLKMLGAKELT